MIQVLFPTRIPFLKADLNDKWQLASAEERVRGEEPVQSTGAQQSGKGPRAWIFRKCFDF